MKSPTLLTRAVAAGVTAVMCTALAACGSSGSSGGDSGGGPGAPETTTSTTSATTNTAPAGSTSASSTGSTPKVTGDGALATANVSPQDAPKIVMGTKNFAEEYTLGWLYTLALQKKGFSVDLKVNIGNSGTINRALESGQINMYPEYTGVIYTTLADKGKTPLSAAKTYEGAKKWENSKGFSMLLPTPFQDRDCIAVLEPYAKKHGLTDISSMKKIDHWVYGGPPENKKRFAGVIGLHKAYDLHNFSFKSIKIGLQYKALESNKIDAAACFTTDGVLASGKYQVLPDTKGIFGNQQVAPVIKTSLLKKMPPEFVQTLNKVSSLLTQKVIIKLNQATQVNQKEPKKVATLFLKANGLL